MQVCKCGSKSVVECRAGSAILASNEGSDLLELRVHPARASDRVAIVRCGVREGRVQIEALGALYSIESILLSAAASWVLRAVDQSALP